MAANNRTGVKLADGSDVRVGDVLVLPDNVFRRIWNSMYTEGATLGDKTVDTMPREGFVAWCKNCMCWEVRFVAKVLSASEYISWDIALVPRTPLAGGEYIFVRHAS